MDNRNDGEFPSPQQIPGRQNPPAPWDDRKGKGMTAGELLVEKVENIITE